MQNSKSKPKKFSFLCTFNRRTLLQIKSYTYPQPVIFSLLKCLTKPPSPSLGHFVLMRQSFDSTFSTIIMYKCHSICHTFLYSTIIHNIYERDIFPTNTVWLTWSWLSSVPPSPSPPPLTPPPPPPPPLPPPLLLPQTNFAKIQTFYGKGKRTPHLVFSAYKENYQIILC